MNGSPPLIPSPAPRKTGWVVYAAVVTFLLFLTTLGCLTLLGLLLSGRELPAGKFRRPALHEQSIDGDEHTRNKIAVISLTGLITRDGDDYDPESGMVGRIKDELRQAVEDDRVKAIVLRINSPGGEVLAADEIYRAVVEARENKPVVVCMDSVCASGGYYVACAAHHIVAADISITASIGVILQTFSVGGYEGSLLDKIGVRFHTFKSGEFKDLLNPTREPTEQEKELVQNLIMEVYEKFVRIVATERDIELSKLKNGIADGRIMSGQQALEAGLVDELGYFEDAVERAKELAKIEKARLVRYVRPFSLRNLLRFLGEAPTRHTKLQIDWMPHRLPLQTGHLYFLPPYLFQ